MTKMIKYMNKAEYEKLKSSGMFWEWYPDCTGKYEEDVMPPKAGDIEKPIADTTGYTDNLVNAHWGYIEDLLKAHGETEDTIALVSFHYKSAFKHGYKHAEEDNEELDYAY